MKKIKIGNFWIFSNRVIGVTIFPFVFLKKSNVDIISKEMLDITINHESIHLKQQAELLCIFFYIWYFLEYGIRIILTGNTNAAYKRICFEKEAYVNEHNLEYLKNRKFWSFLKYLK
jgi:hypothetical protein